MSSKRKSIFNQFQVGILICSSVALSACGGGGSSSDATTSSTGSTTSAGSSTSSTGSTTSSTGSTTSSTGSTTSSTGSTTSSTGSTTSSTGSTTSSTTGTPTSTVTTELADSATLPQPPSNTSPLSQTQDATAQSDLITGAYKYSQGRVMGSGSDCPTTQSTITCPIFTRFRVDASGNVTNDHYAYYPIQKIWVSLLGSSNFSLPSGDLYNGGGTWKTSGFNLTTASSSLNGQWIYSFDNVQFKLSAASTSLASTTIPSTTQVYSANARALTVGLEQTAGSYYVLQKGGFWSSSTNTSDDPNSYANLASFVAAHTNVSTAYCLANVNVNDLVVFNLSSQSINFYNTSSICAKITTQSPVQLSEGVATVAGRKVMEMSLPAQSTTNTSSVQYNLAVALNDTGVAENGKVFQTGYAQQLSGYVNQAAFLDWIHVNHSEVTAASLPQ